MDMHKHRHKNLDLDIPLWTAYNAVHIISNGFLGFYINCSIHLCQSKEPNQ